MISKQLEKVVFDFECDEFGNCPHCKIDFADCDCPGPMQEDLYKYDGWLEAQGLSAGLKETERKIAEVKL